MRPFCHLHTHSQYSILDATLSIPKIAERAKSDSMEAIALTDHGNMFGAIDFYKACTGVGVKPIIGCEMNLTLESHLEKKKADGPFHITLLAKDTTGYKNLIKLSSEGFINGFYYVPRIDLDLLEKHSEGIICLSGCIKSPFASAIITQNELVLNNLLDQFQKIFKENFFLELQRHESTREDLELDGVLEESWLYQHYQEYIDRQKKIEKALVEQSHKRSIRLVATQNCHYLEREDWRAHEVLLNVQSGEPVQLTTIDTMTGSSYTTKNPKRSTFPSHEYYMKSSAEMHALFHDLPEAIASTADIADQCSLVLDFKTKHYPVFYPPHCRGQELSQETREKEVDTFLHNLCEAGLKKRYTAQRLAKIHKLHPESDPMEFLRKRLEYELHIITSKGMADYILIVWDFINWAKKSGIAMGPGRGSGVGSLILYLIEITDIEPIQFNLFFERFINPERPSYPDIDVDICMDRRPDVIQYTIDTYGKDNVAQIITFGTMKAKMAIKDVGRALNIPLSRVNLIAKLVPDDLNITIEKALEKDPDLKNLYEQDLEVQTLLNIARILEGSIRNSGIHAAGLIVSGEPLTEHIPIAIAKDSDMYVTQYSMKPVEMMGMLKIDFLGLKTLTSIQLAVHAIEKRTGIHIDWINLDLDDEKTFQLLNQGKTLGLFQLESGGMQDLARKLHLDNFEEIIAVLSLYRPGPMDMIPSFIARKHGTEPIEYDHPWLEPILQGTYGIMVYQEQVMQIASRLANYSLGEGDVLRRAMGKKDMKEMAKQRDKFVQGAESNAIEKDVAITIFDKMEKFAEYGFNKSHAAAYGYVTYVTAYLKANYPGEWLSALMSCDQDDIEKVSKFMHEARAMHIPCLPPDINESQEKFTFTGTSIRFALSAIKGVGSQVVEMIIEERQKNGPFSSFSDFMARINTKKVGKKVIELLVESGAFDGFSIPRDDLIHSIEKLYEESQRTRKEKEQGILSLFGDEKGPQIIEKATHRRSKEALLFKEKSLLGLFISGHPLEEYIPVMDRLGTLSISEAEALPEGSLFRTAFVIESVEVKISSKTEKKFAIITISDMSDHVLEIPLWTDMYEQHLPLLVENKLLWALFLKEKRRDSNETQISCKWLGDLKKVDLAQVEESQVVFDKMASLLQRQKNYSTQKKSPKASSIQKTVSQESQIISAYTITFDMAKLRASHILKLKKIIVENPGTTPLNISFILNDLELYTLQPRSKYSISPSPAFHKEISLIDSLIHSVN